MDSAPVLGRSSAGELVGGLRSRRHVFTFPPLVLILLLSMEKSIRITERMFHEKFSPKFSFPFPYSYIYLAGENERERFDLYQF